jgi:hypothetical protein
MCFYLTATLPKETNLEKLRKFFDEFEMAFIPIQNNFIEPQLRKGDLYFRATKSYCDCDTVIGSLNRQKEFQNLLNSKKVKTLRKKKWTDEEIHNWIIQKIQKNPKEIGRNLSPLEKKNKVGKWTNFVRELLKNPDIPRVGILKHWYQKGLEDEEISLKDVKKIDMAKITSDFLLNIEEDVLYEFYIPYGA